MSKEQKLDRRSFMGQALGISTAAPAVANLLAKPSRSAQLHRPNIVFIYTDDQRWDAIRAIGRQSWLSTNLDRLLQQGANFRNSFVTLSLCARVFEGARKANPLHDVCRS
ncbi:MAG: hypothetical protein ACRD1R_05145 [Acidobacteriota bacterium]